MISISTEERRVRLGQRHRLAAACRADTVAAVVRDLVCLHATDPATVYLSTWTRLHTPSLEAVDEALEAKKKVLPTEFGQTEGMMGAMFLVDRETGTIVVVSLWHSEEDLRAMNFERFMANQNAPKKAKAKQ